MGHEHCKGRTHGGLRIPISWNKKMQKRMQQSEKQNENTQNATFVCNDDGPFFEVIVASFSVLWLVVGVGKPSSCIYSVSSSASLEDAANDLRSRKSDREMYVRHENMTMTLSSNEKINEMCTR